MVLRTIRTRCMKKIIVTEKTYKSYKVQTNETKQINIKRRKQNFKPAKYNEIFKYRTIVTETGGKKPQ